MWEACSCSNLFQSFLKPIDYLNEASDSACRAISDVFHISRRFMEISKDHHPQATSLPSRPNPSTISIPFRLNENNNAESVGHVQELRHIVLDKTSFRSVQNPSLLTLISVYGEFFLDVWNRAKQDLRWKEKIVYELLTSFRLRGDVVFLHGRHNSKYIRCEYGVLPRK